MSSNELITRSKPRNISFTPDINPYADGSVMAQFGNTKVHITATIEDSVPPWLKGKKSGWVTAEYSMLPMSTHSRIRRERQKVSGRTQEIQRLIGRSLRSVVDLKALGERSLTVDCDVIVADGGTRTTSISGAYVALKIALDKLVAREGLKVHPLKQGLAALSIGISKDQKIIADLNYEEDSSCETDMNIVMTEDGRYVEIQGTAEGEPFAPEQLSALLECANMAMKSVFEEQRKVIEKC